MTIEYRLPELGEDIETGDVISVYVSLGDTVSEEQPLMEIETDKAAIEVPSPAAGVIKEIHVKDGETIKVGQLLVTIEDGAGVHKDTVAKEEAPREQTEEPGPEIEEKTISEETQKETAPDHEAAAEEEITNAPEPEAEKKAEVKKEPKKEGTATPVNQASSHPAPASPSVRRLARELGIDINKVTGTGPGGRISETDLRTSAGSEKKAKEPDAETPAQAKETPAKTQAPQKSGEQVRVKMSKVRKLTAQRLTEAWKAPHVTQYDKADITELEILRKQFGKSVGKAGGKLTMTSILIKVIAKTLKEFPEMNASVDMEKSEIVYKNFYHIGIAVDTERGLLVPVVKDADKKNITELSVELANISERARDKKITVDELRGGTFTITNLGGIGGTYFSPVLNAPEVGILGVSRSQMEPVYIEEKFVPRLMLPLSLSYDHRLVDGANAIKFLRRAIERLEKPHSWFLKVN
jgi:pyruvate dehydrogenase E2 component (dihydrolipoyllysine-residue acetyltransferase)